MTKKSGLAILALIILIFPFSGCRKDHGRKSYTYTIQTPVYKLKSAFLTAINGAFDQAISSPGKIYIKDHYIFLNDVDKGIHIIDNSNPSSPRQIAFLNIPGNQDMAVKGNILYADMYADLLTIDISDPLHVSVLGLMTGLFTERSYVNGAFMDSTEVIVDWVKKDTTVFVDDAVYNPGFCRGCFTLSKSAMTAATATGTAGSMAKMVLLNSYLYAISERHSLSIIDISNERSPQKANSMFAGYDLETIYPFSDKLFLGSAIGMFMYDVSDPLHPASLGTFSHGRACDPVITNGKYAYVTLRSGTSCGGNSNELDVIDIQDIKQSGLVKSYAMSGPAGLSMDGELLFICDGAEGVKLYNAADPSALKLLSKISSNEPNDVIAVGRIALVVAKDGLYQYDYTNPYNVRQLSFFATK